MPTQRTLLAVHAHPDDECISTGGILARYAAEGVRTVLVTCTDGAVGEISDPALATPDNLVEVRSHELDESVRILNISRLVKLGYRDSGMAGTADNDDPRSFLQSSFEEAVERVTQVVRQEHPQVIVTYDERGGYGHPDHIRAHQVAVAAFHAAGDSARYPSAGAPFSPGKLYYAVVPRSAMRTFAERLRSAGVDVPFQEVRGGTDAEEVPFGVADERVTTFVDISAYVGVKRASLLAHRTQMGQDQFFVRIPEAVFGDVFGRETFQRVEGPGPVPEDDLFAGLNAV
jgi:N-acetyl-1-D-myo-inositol-2-amino-2-deoxy-alpha-D-glucopyranoside deacetylase